MYILSFKIQRDRKNMCDGVMDRDKDGCKLPVIIMGPSDTAQNPTQNISYTFIYIYIYI
jgi:hypothetical protein